MAVTQPGCLRVEISGPEMRKAVNRLVLGDEHVIAAEFVHAMERDGGQLVQVPELTRTRT